MGIFVGKYDSKDCFHLDYIDYDSTGYMMTFKNKMNSTWKEMKDSLRTIE